MIEEGEHAPHFEVPAVVDGDETTVGLDDHLGKGVVVLAFYPGDFNPACTDDGAGLDSLDLFQMQKDVSVLAISTDSVYSHQAFATAYDLRIPLLADVTGKVTTAYDVAVEAEAGYGADRAVVVIDHEGAIEYTWHTDEAGEVPPVDQIREAVEGVGGREVATARYRVGHAHYIEGRRAFTSAMREFEDREWTLAQGDFQQARTEFETAADEFDTASRFAEDETSQTYYDRAFEKANALWQAAEWLADSANAFASGEGASGESMRSDAHTPLEAAREIHEPPDPDDFPPDEDPATSHGGTSFIPADSEETPASLDMDLDDKEFSAENADTTADANTAATENQTVAIESSTDSGTNQTETAAGTESDSRIETAERVETDEQVETAGRARPDNQAGSADTSETDDQADVDESAEIDEEELEEITAELEEQSEEIEQSQEREAGEEQAETDRVAKATDDTRSGSLSESGSATLEPTDSKTRERDQSDSVREGENDLDPNTSESIDLTDADDQSNHPGGDLLQPKEDESRSAKRDEKHQSDTAADEEEDR